MGHRVAWCTSHCATGLHDRQLAFRPACSVKRGGLERVVIPGHVIVAPRQPRRDHSSPVSMPKKLEKLREIARAQERGRDGRGGRHSRVDVAERNPTMCRMTYNIHRTELNGDNKAQDGGARERHDRRRDGLLFTHVNSCHHSCDV